MVPEQPAAPAGGSTAVRFVAGVRQFIRFGIVGGSGVLVNFVVFYLANKALENGLGLHANDVVMQLGSTRWNVRWYHVMYTLAFVLANTWNYQLNRIWTFRTVSKVSWIRGFFPFLLTGIGAFIVSQVILTLLMNPNSPLGLPTDVFDNSTGLRTKSYWAQAISIVVAMPINFIINKLWTFRSTPNKPVVVDEVAPV